jgi:hypothetical protein
MQLLLGRASVLSRYHVAVMQTKSIFKLQMGWRFRLIRAKVGGRKGAAIIELQRQLLYQ